MKKKTIITILAVFALLFALSLDNKAEYKKDQCANDTCKDDGLCDQGDPSQGWACTTSGTGSDCSMYYNCWY